MRAKVHGHTPRVYHVDHPHNDTDDDDVGHAVKSDLIIMIACVPKM